MPQASELALGTAQLGMPYGIANETGVPDSRTASEIVSAAWDSGIRWFDTAQAYGRSEPILGRCFRELAIQDRVRVVSKLHPDAAGQNASSVLDRIRASVDVLGVPSLRGLLLHCDTMLDAWTGQLSSALSEARRQGLVEYLGASVYSPQRAIQALELPEFDLIQIPVNVFDRRMERAGIFARAHELGKTVFVRSVYLQGLALMDVSHLPESMAFAEGAVLAYSGFCEEHRCGRARFALHYLRDQYPAAVLVIGAETPAQVRENCRLADLPSGDRGRYRSWNERWPGDIDQLVDPSKWPGREG